MKALPCFAVMVAAALAGLANAAEAWRALPLIANGKVDPAWTMIGWGGFAVDGDTLRTKPDDRGMGLLLYQKEKFGDCQLRIVYRCERPKSNSGIYVRLDDGVLGKIGEKSPEVHRNGLGRLSLEMLKRLENASDKNLGAWYPVHHGYEVQIMDATDAFHRTGAIYSLAKAEPVPPKAQTEWRTMIITLEGERIAVEVDGKNLSSFDAAGQLPPRQKWTEPIREIKRPTAGYIGLQSHDPGDLVWFKEVSVRTKTSAQTGEVISNIIGLKLVRIPAGEFTMGSPSSEKGRRSDEPQRPVRITRGFFMGQFEVTRGQFRQFVEATQYKTGAERGIRGGYGFDEVTQSLSGPDHRYSWRFTGYPQTDDHPVVNVSWNDALAFCGWLSEKEKQRYRLPTEAEWEYACRGGAVSAYCNGTEAEKVIEVGNIMDSLGKQKFPDRQAVAGSDSFVFTAPVGSFRANIFGLHDMHGNVWEWCADWFGPADVSSQVDPTGPPNGKDKVVRGGDWYHDWSFARSAQRSPIHPSLCRRHAGFRVVREIAP